MRNDDEVFPGFAELTLDVLASYLKKPPSMYAYLMIYDLVSL